MSKWADETYCTHGFSFSDECDRCEMVGLKESLSWMKRWVKRDERLLAELQKKFCPDFNPKTHEYALPTTTDDSVGMKR